MQNQMIREVIAQFRASLPVHLSTLIEQGAGEVSALDIIERARRHPESTPMQIKRR